MKTNARLGGILAIIGALMGIIGHYVLFLDWYHIGMAADSAEPGCEILLKYIHPALADLGILAGVLFAVSAYGFFTKRNWAFLLSVMAITLALLSSWFINVPYMAASLPPVYFTLFWPYLILYFVLLKGVGRVSWSITLLALVTGLAYITCFMNGVSSTSRIITIGSPLFVLVQRLHWFAMVGWGVVTVGIILRPREWMRVVGLISGSLELAVGIPLAYATAMNLGRFSLFALAPIISLILVILFLWPNMWLRLTGAEGEDQTLVETDLTTAPAD
jgi:NADH:ubiquinone oxidoreductase subunit K